MRQTFARLRIGALAAKAGEDCYSLFISLVLVAAVTGGLMILDRAFAITHVSIVYLIPVVIAATRFGVIPAIVAAIAGVGASAFFFYPPIYSLRIADPQQLLDLPLFVFVAIVTGHLASSLRRQATVARVRERSMRDLYAFSRKLARAYEASDIYGAIQDHLSSIIQRKVVLFETGPGAASTRPAAVDLPEVVRSSLFALADTRGATVFDEGTGNTWLVRRISHRTPEFSLMAIDLGPGDGETIKTLKGNVDAIWSDVVATLERLDLGHAIADAKMRAETDLLRDALIGSVSHELKTPLASILGAATVLRQGFRASGDPRLDSLANLICEEAERLNTDIQNLLDASRISSQGVRPHLEWVEPADIVNSAVERKRQRLDNHRVALDLPDDVPLAYVDPVMIEQALAQIIDNAAKYSDAGSTITIALRRDGARLVVAVADDGSGLTTEEQERLGERFFRGRQASTVTGSGLGLWIAQAFVNANGGVIRASSPGMDRGSVVSIYLPISAIETAENRVNAHA